MRLVVQLHIANGDVSITHKMSKLMLQKSLYYETHRSLVLLDFASTSSDSLSNKKVYNYIFDLSPLITSSILTLIVSRISNSSFQ